MDIEQIRDRIHAALFHAEIGVNGYKTLDLLKGYDMGKWRIQEALQALTGVDDALDVFIARQKRLEPGMDIKGVTGKRDVEQRGNLNGG